MISFIFFPLIAVAIVALWASWQTRRRWVAAAVLALTVAAMFIAIGSVTLRHDGGSIHNGPCMGTACGN